MLMNWSSPFLNEESSTPIKQKIRPKLMNNRRIETPDDDNELQDYMPKSGMNKLKEKKEKDKEKVKENMETYQPSFEESEYPMYDKPLESKESQLLEKLNYMIYF